MARGLSATQGAVSKVLRRLTAADVVRPQRRHVPGRSRRVKVYLLTFRGDELVREIQRAEHLAQRPPEG